MRACVAVVAVVAVLAVAGCGADGGRLEVICTKIGCGPDGAKVEVEGIPSGDVEIVLCVQQRNCVRRRRGEPLQFAGAALPKRADQVRVALIVRKDGRVVARATRRFPVKHSRPNGPDCPPPCPYLRLRFDVPTETLEEAA